ncbi:MAG: hypothetical protein OHK0022_20290 [Roseiflexaceae bacterium]
MINQPDLVIEERDEQGEPRLDLARLEPGQGALHYRPARRIQMRYRFVNRQDAPCQLWLALPPELPTQRQVQIDGLTPEPQQVADDVLGLNRLAFFTLEPGQELCFTLRAELHAVEFRPGQATGEGPLLSEAERAVYLRSTRLITVTDEVRAEALRIVGDAPTMLEQARRLYMHLVRFYRYQWPPAARGSEAMRRSRRGDCGEYSFLYAAWCRALGIPCRVMVGTFAHGQLNAHVWNEVFLDGIGWMPVDSSIFQTPLRVPLLADLDWALQRVAARFGCLPADRLVFSIDPEVPLTPAFVEQTAPDRLARDQVGGQQLAWGYESLDGSAPYMQPIYLRFPASSHPAEGVKTPLLERLLRWPVSGEVERLLGRWSFDDPLAYRLGTWLMVLGFMVGVLGTLLDNLGVAGFDLPRILGYIVANIVFIRRTGVRWWKLLLLGLFTIELIARLAG